MDQSRSVEVILTTHLQGTVHLSDGGSELLPALEYAVRLVLYCWFFLGGRDLLQRDASIRQRADQLLAVLLAAQQLLKKKYLDYFFSIYRRFASFYIVVRFIERPRMCTIHNIINLVVNESSVSLIKRIEFQNKKSEISHIEF